MIRNPWWCWNSLGVTITQGNSFRCLIKRRAMCTTDGRCNQSSQRWHHRSHTDQVRNQFVLLWNVLSDSAMWFTHQIKDGLATDVSICMADSTSRQVQAPHTHSPAGSGLTLNFSHATPKGSLNLHLLTPSIIAPVVADRSFLKLKPLQHGRKQSGWFGMFKMFFCVFFFTSVITELCLTALKQRHI